jgi:hypothetical protein
MRRLGTSRLVTVNPKPPPRPIYGPGPGDARATPPAETERKAAAPPVKRKGAP